MTEAASSLKKLQLLVFISPATLHLTLPLLCCSGRLVAHRKGNSWKAPLCTLMCTLWLSYRETTYLLLMTLQNTPTSLGSTGSMVSVKIPCVGQTLPKGARIPHDPAVTTWYMQEKTYFLVQTCPPFCCIFSWPS